MSLFETPRLTAADRRVLDEIEELRRQLRFQLREPRRWTGLLRRTLTARAIRGSNTIEGYTVTLDDALAAVEDEPPLEADKTAWQEILGYRRALTYVQELAKVPALEYNATLLNALHFMMLGHDLAKSPGQFRPGSVYVHDGVEAVYEGPPSEGVPGLVVELSDWLNAGDLDASIFVRGTMAHLNLVMIHPWRDGNGRMARCLQTLVLARDGVLEPEFSSIEEWLGVGRNTTDYYAVLADVGGGRWSPGHDATRWLRFCLRAHHLQAQTILRRATQAAAMWAELEKLAAERHLPARSVHALYTAAIGLRVRRPVYETDADVESGTASRDLRLLTEADLLRPQGRTRGRTYAATDRLRDHTETIRRQGRRLREPYDG